VYRANSIVVELCVILILIVIVNYILNVSLDPYAFIARHGVVVITDPSVVAGLQEYISNSLESSISILIWGVSCYK